MGRVGNIPTTYPAHCGWINKNSLFERPTVENEFHFLFICNLYDQLRNDWATKLQLPANFSNFDQSEKLKIVLNDHNNVKLTTQFIIDAYDLRSKTINSKP